MKATTLKLAAALFAVAAAAPATSALAADSAKVFKPLVTPEEVFNPKSAAWKPIPNKEGFADSHDDEFYLLAAKRDDGKLMVMVRKPGVEHPETVFYYGAYFTCGVMADVMFFPGDAAGLKKEFAEPQADDSEGEIGRAS